MEPPQKELPSWVAKRDDKHGEETKDKAFSEAGKCKVLPDFKKYTLIIHT